MSTERRQPGERRLSLLIRLQDSPGALLSALEPFSRHGVNLTHIESRPARGETFDFYVDCEGARGEAPVEAVISEFGATGFSLLVLDDKTVPWFPRHVSELEAISGHTLDAGTDLQADHPGFNDPIYRERRAHIDALARAYRYGQDFPRVAYEEQETAAWSAVYERLRPLHEAYGCVEYRRVLGELEQHCGYGPDQIPQGADVSAFLESRTGFRIWPIAGLLSSRDFLNGLAFRVFFATQYLRHHSRPLYTPEPDVVHELLGHAPMFADPAFADLSQEIGLASLGATDAEIERLARCYWHSVEFGMLKEDGVHKAYGAGLLSSFGELAYAVGKDPERQPEYRAFEPEAAAEQTYPITDYQPVYFVSDSLQHARQRMRAFCRSLPRPFFARYNAATERIWVDRAVRRLES